MEYQKLYASGQASLSRTQRGVALNCASGFVFAVSLDEAMGKALRMYREQFPEHTHHVVSAWEIPIEDLRNAVKQWESAHPEATE